MSNLAITIGRRIRNYRKSLNLSQEKLAEMASCHATYIGQLERGEKNATLESIEKITDALGVSLSQLFDKLGSDSVQKDNYPLMCYELVLDKSEDEQVRIFKILSEIEKYKEI